MYITKKYIENKLINYVAKDTSQLDSNVSNYVIREHNPEETLLVQTGIKKYIIKFLFKYKNTIKKIPFLGKYLVNKKDKMYQDAYGEISINHILKLPPYLFLENLYKIALERDIDRDGLVYYLALYRYFATNEAIAYMVFTSNEYNNRASVENINVYKKAFITYRVKNRLYKNIFIRCFILLFGSYYFIKKRDKVISEYEKVIKNF